MKVVEKPATQIISQVKVEEKPAQKVVPINRNFTSTGQSNFGDTMG